MNDIALQPVVFVACLGAGVLSGLVYALLYLVRRRFAFKRLVEAVCDLAFVLVSAGLYFVVLYTLDYGAMRLYTVAAFLGGFAVTYALLSPLKDKLPALGEKIKGWLRHPHLPRLKRRKRQ